MRADSPRRDRIHHRRVPAMGMAAGLVMRNASPRAKAAWHGVGSSFRPRPRLAVTTNGVAPIELGEIRDRTIRRRCLFPAAPHQHLCQQNLHVLKQVDVSPVRCRVKTVADNSCERRYRRPYQRRWRRRRLGLHQFRVHQTRR